MREQTQKKLEPLTQSLGRASRRVIAITGRLALFGAFAGLIAGCTFQDGVNATKNWFIQMGQRAEEIIHGNYDVHKLPVAQVHTTPSLLDATPPVVQVSQTPKPVPYRKPTPTPTKTPTPTPKPTETPTPTATATENASEVKLREVSHALENGLKQLEGKTVLFEPPHNPVEADVCAALTAQRMLSFILKQGGYSGPTDIRTLSKEIPQLRTSGAIIAYYTKGGIMFRGQEENFRRLIGIHNPGPFIVAAPLKGLDFSLDYLGYPSAVGQDISKSQTDGFLLLGSYRDIGRYAKALRIWGNRAIISVILPGTNTKEHETTDNPKITVYNFIAHTRANTVNRDTVFLRVQKVEIKKGVPLDQVSNTIADYIVKNTQLPPRGKKTTLIEWIKGFFKNLRNKK